MLTIFRAWPAHPRLLPVLMCAILCLGCEELLDTILYGPELCAEGIVTDEARDPVPEATVALIWHCSGTDCNSMDCSECNALGDEHVLTNSAGYYKVTDRVLDGDCACDQCLWDLKANAPGYRLVEHEDLGWRCGRCEVRNFTLERTD